MDMFKRILVPIDGSAGSREALGLAAAIAAACSSRITVLHVVEPKPRGLLLTDSATWSAIYTHAFIDRLVEKGNAVLSAADDFLQEEPVDVKFSLKMGSPADVICETAGKEKFDLVVMGSRGMSDFKGTLLGSVSHDVLRKSPVPVLLAKASSAVPGKTAGVESAASRLK